MAIDQQLDQQRYTKSDPTLKNREEHNETIRKQRKTLNMYKKPVNKMARSSGQHC